MVTSGPDSVPSLAPPLMNFFKFYLEQGKHSLALDELCGAGMPLELSKNKARDTMNWTIDTAISSFPNPAVLPACVIVADELAKNHPKASDIPLPIFRAVLAGVEMAHTGGVASESELAQVLEDLLKRKTGSFGDEWVSPVPAATQLCRFMEKAALKLCTNKGGVPWI